MATRTIKPLNKTGRFRMSEIKRAVAVAKKVSSQSSASARKVKSVEPKKYSSKG